VKTIILHKEDVNSCRFAIIYNTLQKDTSNSEKEAVEHIYRQFYVMLSHQMRKRRVGYLKNYSSQIHVMILGEVGRFRINKKLELGYDMEIRVLDKSNDIISIIKYLIELINSKADVDDIDHLSNRRVRTVGEQLYSQFGVGLQEWQEQFVSE
jgi:DNA-directed RNA polymerase subunit beta